MSEMNNPLAKKSYDFSLIISGVYKNLIASKKELVLSKQLLKRGTSIGANVAEANGAISKADFSAKISITYKESLEVKYWLSLLKDSKYLELDAFQNAFEKVDELSKIMFSILKTTRIKN